jgi:putative transposase
VSGAVKAGGVPVGLLCECAGMSRQNFYKGRKVRERTWVDESLVLELIRRERAVHPRIGGRKLLFLIGGDLESAGVEIGRDRFFALLLRHDLLIRRKRRGAKTTDSWHGFGVYPNLAKGMEVTGPHQLWVADITYIRTAEGFIFLSLVMDVFSRAIVGYDSSDSLEMEGALAALTMAQKQLPEGSRTVHHSDRGSQYCCRAYVAKMKSRQMEISMTEENHCYENGKAERLNGIMKQEYGLGEEFATKRAARAGVAEAVEIYNNRRPHGALGYRIPMRVHEAGGFGVSSAPGGLAPQAPKGKKEEICGVIGVGN